MPSPGSLPGPRAGCIAASARTTRRSAPPMKPGSAAIRRGQPPGSARAEMSHRSRTRVLTVDPEEPDPAVLAEAARVLRGGGLVAFATETVYGLGAVATDARAVAQIFAAKGRPARNPLIVHVAEIGQARTCVVDWPEEAQELARRFWPGPLTLILNRSGRIPDVVSAGQPTVAVRAPAGTVARGLIDQAGAPIAAPSANRSNRL